jgi:glutamate 5-kinase
MEKKTGNREKWLLVGASAKGKIEIDEGAAAALKDGKSLLAVGVSDAMGDFDTKDIVEVVDEMGKTLGSGIINYSKEEIEKALDYRKKKQNDKIRKEFIREIIHVDNLTIL